MHTEFCGKKDSRVVILWSGISSKQHTSDYPRRIITLRYYSPSIPFQINTACINTIAVK